MVEVLLSQIYDRCHCSLTHETAEFDLRQLFVASFGRWKPFGKDDVVTQAEALQFYDKVAKLKDGYPLQYILGEWEFYSIPLVVGDGVLIPRPDTETLVDVALEQLKAFSNPVIADFCSGSGAIAIALAKNCTGCHVHAVEFYEKAFYYLELNVKRLKLSSQITLYNKDVFEDFSLPQLDMLVSNPPYLSQQEMAEIPIQVSYEPDNALLGGSDGLKYYRHITQRARLLLKSGGILAYECGYSQTKQVQSIMEASGFKNVEIHCDLGGNPRCVLGFNGNL